MGDETVLAQRSSAITGSKSILPDGQGTQDTEDALDRDNSYQQKVNDSEVEVPHKGPTAKIPDPNDRQGANVEEHNDSMKKQYDIGKAGKKWAH